MTLVRPLALVAGLLVLGAAARPGAASAAPKVSGLVWIDTDRDGIRDTGEPPRAGVAVTLQRRGRAVATRRRPRRRPPPRRPRPSPSVTVSGATPTPTAARIPASPGSPA